MELLHIKVIIGSTRKGRFSEKPAQWIFSALRERAEVEAELLDLRDYSMPFISEEMTPSEAQGKYANPQVQRWAEKIKEGDAFIAVTPEYNHGYPAILKNALDSIYIEWNQKPIGFVSYGSAGGARSVEQLRLVAIELQMAPIKNAIHIPVPWTLLDEQGNLKENAFGQFDKKAENFLGQLIWWSKALKTARGG